MPKVGKMKFPYTPRGIEDAQNYANHSGKALEMELPKYKYGGRVGSPMNPLGNRRIPRMRPPVGLNPSGNNPMNQHDPGGGRAAQHVSPEFIMNQLGSMTQSVNPGNRLNRGMRPSLPTYRNGGMVPRRPGMGRKMSPNQINMLRNKLAKFKKGIV